MIYTEKSNNVKSFMLWGDYYSLRWIHTVIHDMVNNNYYLNHDEPISNFVLGLAYEIRKAYEKSRQQKKIEIDIDKKETYFGTDLYYPFAILQIGTLRKAAAYDTTTYSQQAGLFMLESCLENALRERDPGVAIAVMKWLKYFSGLEGLSILNIEEEIAREWVNTRKTKTLFTSLPNLVQKVTMYPFIRELLEDKGVLD